MGLRKLLQKLVSLLEAVHVEILGSRQVHLSHQGQICLCGESVGVHNKLLATRLLSWFHI
jgi:hypothetical protein